MSTNDNKGGKIKVAASTLCPGIGLFADQDFKKGDLIEDVPVQTKRYDDADAEALRKKLGFDSVPDHNFGFVWDVKYEHTHFPIGLIGYANHASQPNTRVERDVANGRCKTFALQDIKKGTELTHYYGDPGFVKQIENAIAANTD
eukprot:CAMPEP_0201552074 /NCGR_PEP_ID=MMETSP0173_2-20130828/13318_1 /ASSEMBLY_ACC=CAM_ASM_000268 /TAXON_ID=218659 /ORGANISM="Vexillifera sp., Strain DIVA3 564/2" /LENGTH=144 /DNA_ID=CAMNT_0047962487 /DNA_START=90 /DNA_END=524 /DNA_ORIENTATION=+